jgi:tagaturonate reductase
MGIMKLDKKILHLIDQQIVSVPTDDYFELPEKVLQFGTGVLLRGLPDYFIDKANKQQIFNGRIVVVKSTDTPGANAFDEQNGLFTHCIRGIENGQLIDEYHLNASISRVLTAATQWDSIINLASSSVMQLIISNTTESGLVLDEEDKIREGVPKSFPGKLLAFLYKRWQVFNGAHEAGMIILPTELIPDNGKFLLNIVNQLAEINQLEDAFIQWMNKTNHFCNTLVDRIVPGKLNTTLAVSATNKIGYEDDLMIMSEPFRLWAIETSSHRVQQLLSFSEADKGVIIADSIQQFRELKLRLLNGTHSFSCALAILAGFDTVKEAMQNNIFVDYLDALMKVEISTCLINDQIDFETAFEFAETVKERFANPFIEHRWASISVNYTEKLRMRTISLISNYIEREKKIPEQMSIGFAAYLLYMYNIHLINGKYQGNFNNLNYTIDDAKSELFASIAAIHSMEEYVHLILSDQSLWGTDLTYLASFEIQINQIMNDMSERGVLNFFVNQHNKAIA